MNDLLGEVMKSDSFPTDIESPLFKLKCDLEVATGKEDKRMREKRRERDSRIRVLLILGRISVHLSIWS